MILGVGLAAQASFAAVLWGVPVLAPALTAHYHLSLAALGLVLASTSYGMTVTLLAWGWLADRLGERRVIAIGLGVSAATLVGAAFAPDLHVLVGALALTGVFGAAVIPASGRAVMGWFSPAERGLALGIRQTGVPLGAAASALVLPITVSHGGLRLAFFLLAGMAVGGAGLTAAALRRPDVVLAPGAPPPAADAGRPLLDGRIWRITLGGALLFPVQSCMLAFVVVFLHQERGVATSTAGAVLAGIQLLGAALRIAAGRWSDAVGARVAPLRLLAWTMALGLAAVAVSTHAPLALLVPVIVVAGSLSISWNGLVYTATAEVAGRQRSGLALGLQQTGLAIAGAAAPIAIAAIIGSTSWSIGFAAVGVCPLAALGFLRGSVKGV